jgi:hypothetical protein
MHPPSAEMRRAALAGGPVSQEDRLSASDSNAATIELQPRQLRSRCAVAYRFACSRAPLKWGLPQ